MKRFFLCLLLAFCTASLQAVTVTSTTDDRTDPTFNNSLRYAIEQMNLTTTGGLIQFNVLPADGSPAVVTLQSALPGVSVPLVISGQVATDGTTPMVQIDGSAVGGDGLVFEKSAEVDSLVITGFSGSGVVFNGNGSKIKGCYVGIDNSGAAAANGVGITVTGGTCLIGTGTDGRSHNVISGNTGAGVLITGSTAIGNKVYGNLIGTDPGGSSAIANLNGVQIDTGASVNFIGLAGNANGNIISGNSAWGVSIGSGSANQVENNWIGLDLANDGVAVPNGSAGSGGIGGGILIDDAVKTTIKNCVISGNSGFGIQITDGANNTTVVSSKIGVDVSGMNIMANSADGIVVGDTNAGIAPVWSTTIGGIGSTGTNVVGGLGNVISGNSGNGVNIVSSNSDVIQGNFIGIAADSSQALANGIAGIQITGTDETVGGTVAGTGNVVSGNSADGIALANSSRATISGNIIGLDATGAFSIPNGQNGIDSQTSDLVVIGGASAGAHNVISGNTSSGIILGGDSNTVLGNYIGCSADGTLMLGNGTVSTADAGIAIVSGSLNTIGGVDAGDGNSILANIGDGIRIDGANTEGNLVLGNWIGFGLDGSVDTTTANGQNGVGLYNGANANIIGTLTTKNLIAANGGDAVFVSEVGAIQNTIRGNSILMLGLGVPIDLSGGSGDHTGPNNLMDQPIISDVSLSGSIFVVSGTYTSSPGIHVLLDLYHIDPNAAVPMYEYVSTTAVDTDVTGNVPFSIPASGAYGGHTFALAATDASGNTSPFSADSAAPKVFQFAKGGAPVSVKESAGKLYITVTRAGDITNGDSIEFSTQDLSARAGIDYVGVSGSTIYFDSGHSTAQIVITLLNNTIPNGERLFQVLLANPSDGVVAGTAVMTVSIADNQAPNGVFSVTAATPFVDEGRVSSVAFVIRRSGGLLTSATVDYATVPGGALAGAGKDFLSASGRLAFAKTQTSGTVTVRILSNVAYKANLTFTFKLSACSAGCALVAPSSALQTICDLANPYGTLELSAADTRANEVGPSATVTVTRLGGAAGTATIRYATSNGTALANANYRAVSGILTFKPLQRTATFSVPTIDDHLYSANKSFYVNLSTPGGGATLGALRTGTVTLLDSDNPAGVFQFAASTVTAAKGARTVAVKVSRLGGSTGAVSVPYTFQTGTARAGINFTAKNGALSFAGGVTSANINVPVIGSLVHSAPLTFGITLTSANGGATLGAQPKVTVVLPAN